MLTCPVCRAGYNPIRVQMCFAHVAAIWCRRADNKALLRDPENLSRIKADLATLNWCQHDAEMVPIAQALMYKKWRTKYREVRWTAAFERAWGQLRWTRAEANEGGDGGIPSDNNGLESKNGKIKAGLRRERPVLTTFIPRSLEWLECDSIRDDSFGQQYNRRLINCKFWASVAEAQSRQVQLLSVVFEGTWGKRFTPSAITLQQAIQAGCDEV